MERLEALGQLCIGQQCLPSQVRSGTNQWNPQIIGQKPDRIEKYPLLPEGAGQHAVHLIENDHFRPHGPQQRPADILLAGERAACHRRRAYAGQKFPVKIAFNRFGWHLRDNHRAVINAGHLAELWRMVTFEFPHDLGLAHAGVAIDQQAGHSVTRRIAQQVLQTCQSGAGLIEPDPAVGPDPDDTLIIRKCREPTVGRIEMRKCIILSHDHSSTSKPGWSLSTFSLSFGSGSASSAS